MQESGGVNISSFCNNIEERAADLAHASLPQVKSGMTWNLGKAW